MSCSIVSSASLSSGALGRAIATSTSSNMAAQSAMAMEVIEALALARFPKPTMRDTFGWAVCTENLILCAES